MICVGENKAILCKGDFAPAALYKGSTFIGGAASTNFEGETISAEHTYNAPLSIEALGKTEQNGTPTPDTPVEIQKVLSGTSVDVVGKNLFDVSNLPNVVLNSIVLNGLFQTNSQYRTLFLKLLPNTTYTLTRKAGIHYFYLAECATIPSLGDSVTAISKMYPENSTISFTLSATDNYLALSWLEAQAALSVYDLQIELGSTATSYQPYQSGGSALSEYNLYSGDKWNVVSGEYTFDKAVYEFTGNETLTLGSISNQIQFHIDGVKAGACLCSHFKTQTYYSSDNKPYVHIGSTGIIWFELEEGKSLDYLRNLLAAQKAAGTPVTLVHERAVPLVIEGTARLISSVPRHTNIYSVPASGGLVPSLQTTMKTY